MCAFVVPDGAHEPRLAELTHFLEEQGVARYKQPEFLVVLPQLPMTPTGKVQKFALCEAVSEGRCTVEAE